MSAVVVMVPDGLCPGDSFVIEVYGREWTVDVPDDACAGHEIELMLPVDEDSDDSSNVCMSEEEDSADSGSLVVLVPHECGPGDVFVVETTGPTGDPFSFEVIVPDACYGGMELVVQVPPPPPPPPPPEGKESSYAARLRTMTKESSYVDEVHAEDPDVLVLRASRVGDFTTFVNLEVERSDGSWSSGATAEEYDEWGDTYTVRLSDGRLKYMVEPRSLRRVRVGSLSKGQAVLCATRARGKMYGVVDDYDDVSEQYTLRLVSTGQFRLVAEDEIETVNMSCL